MSKKDEPLQAPDCLVETDSRRIAGAQKIVGNAQEREGIGNGTRPTQGLQDRTRMELLGPTLELNLSRRGQKRQRRDPLLQGGALACGAEMVAEWRQPPRLPG